YPERLRRYEEFCRLALELGAPETSGVLSVKPDKWFLLGDYYRHRKQFVRAAACYLRSWRRESRNKEVLVKAAECCRELGDAARARRYYEKALAINASVAGFGEDPYDAVIRKALESLGPAAKSSSPLVRA
ncbi:MAG TPA: hypothetical protein P5079_00550, partial [Elusimicrobiota bacterium]|nr:hypothetical protein [Elusimicrobiota bacterium]